MICAKLSWRKWLLSKIVKKEKEISLRGVRQKQSRQGEQQTGMLSQKYALLCTRVWSLISSFFIFKLHKYSFNKEDMDSKRRDHIAWKKQIFKSFDQIATFDTILFAVIVINLWKSIYSIWFWIVQSDLIFNLIVQIS